MRRRPPRQEYRNRMDVYWIRSICERWPAFREKLPEVRAVLRDTNVPA